MRSWNAHMRSWNARVHSWHAHVHLQTVLHSSSLYTRALNDRFDAINLECIRMLVCMHVKLKHVMLSPCHTCVLSCFN